MYDISPEDILRYGQRLNIGLREETFEQLQLELRENEVLFAFYYIRDIIRNHLGEQDSYKNTFYILGLKELIYYQTAVRNSADIITHGDYFAVPIDKCLDLSLDLLRSHKSTA